MKSDSALITLASLLVTVTTLGLIALIAYQGAVTRLMEALP